MTNITPHEPRETNAVGNKPGEMPNMGEAPDGHSGIEQDTAHEKLPDTVGNINHSEAMSIDEIRAWKQG